MRKVLPFIFLLIATIFAFPSSIFAESTIHINEVYPSPLDQPDVEYIEINILKPEEFPNQLIVCDSRWNPTSTDFSKCKTFEPAIIEPHENLLVLETGRNFLNNSGDAIYLIDNTDPDNSLIIDFFFYGNTIPPQEYSESPILPKPNNGESISYIADTTKKYHLTSPTKGEENWLVE